MLGDRQLRMARADMQRGKQRQSDTSQVMIQDLPDPVTVVLVPLRPPTAGPSLLVFDRMPDFVHTCGNRRGS